jgi:hypothetical protein
MDSKECIDTLIGCKSYYQIVYIFPYPNDVKVFYVPVINVSTKLYKEMCDNFYPPEELENLPNILEVSSDDGRVYGVPKDLKIFASFYFIV